MGWEVNFDMTLRDPLMLAFFATIGLNANIASLRAGGRVVGIFLIVVVGLLLMQNAIGIGITSLLGLDPLMGLIAGSITLSGYHGTGAARASCLSNATALLTRRKWRWRAPPLVWFLVG